MKNTVLIAALASFSVHGSAAAHLIHSQRNMAELDRFTTVNPRISLAALHDRMIVFAQDARGLHSRGRRATRQGVQLPLSGVR